MVLCSQYFLFCAGGQIVENQAIVYNIETSFKTIIFSDWFSKAGSLTERSEF